MKPVVLAFCQLLMSFSGSTYLWAQGGCGSDGSVYPETLIAPWGRSHKMIWSVALDENGEYVSTVAWYGGDRKIRVSVLKSCGEAIAGPFVTDRGGPAVVGKRPDGEFLGMTPVSENCAWGLRPSIWIQPYNREGIQAGEEIKIYPDGACGDVWSEDALSNLYVAVDRAGNYIVAWAVNDLLGNGDEASETIIRKYDRRGEWLNQEFKLDVRRLEELSLKGPVHSRPFGLETSENGDLMFVTGGHNPLGFPGVVWSYYVWRLDENLDLQGLPFPVGNSVFGDAHSVVAADANGNLVVAWQYPGDDWIQGKGDVWDRIRAQRFSRSGERIGEEIAVSGPPIRFSQYSEGSPKVAMDSAGNFVVVWWWKKRGLFVGQRFNAGGERIGRIFQINVSGPGGYGLVSMNNRGKFAVGYFLGVDPGPQAVGTRVLDLYEKEFIRGDANDSGEVDISDVITIIDYLFLGGTIEPVVNAGDANDDGKVDLSDAIYLVGHLFLGPGYYIPHPYPFWGFDPTENG